MGGFWRTVNNKHELEHKEETKDDCYYCFSYARDFSLVSISVCYCLSKSIRHYFTQFEESEVTAKVQISIKYTQYDWSALEQGLKLPDLSPNCCC